MYIVTGASNNHFRSLCQFLHSVPDAQREQTYVWNLGLTVENLDFLQKTFPTLRKREFPYSEYPAFFNIEVEAGQYAWKPVAIWLTALEVSEGVLLWCDAGNRIMGSLLDIQVVIEEQGVYSPISAGTVRKWTHPLCLAWFGLEHTDPMLSLSPRNGAIIGFHLNHAGAWQLLETWAKLAQEKDCIAPVGSSRENHRQDQAVFTILYYQFTKNHVLETAPMCLLTHQDCD